MQASVRTDALRARRALGLGARIRAALAITDTVLALDEFARASKFGFYWAMRDEVDARRLAHAPSTRGKRAYLPVARYGRALRFVEYTGTENLVMTRGGIREPDLTSARDIAPMSLDCVIVPLVAFDDACNRIGMGAGFYDRTFAPLAARKGTQSPALIGVAFEVQRVKRIVPNDWDVALDAVVTESAVVRRTA